MKYAFVETIAPQYGVPAAVRGAAGLAQWLLRCPAAGPQCPTAAPSRPHGTRFRTPPSQPRVVRRARVHVELLAQKVPCCRNTVAKLMRRAEILPKAIRRFRVTTDSRQTKALAQPDQPGLHVKHPNASG